MLTPPIADAASLRSKRSTRRLGKGWRSLPQTREEENNNIAASYEILFLCGRRVGTIANANAPSPSTSIRLTNTQPTQSSSTVVNHCVPRAFLRLTVTGNRHVFHSSCRANICGRNAESQSYRYSHVGCDSMEYMNYRRREAGERRSNWLSLCSCTNMTLSSSSYYVH